MEEKTLQLDDPSRFFGFMECNGCMFTPCKELRAGIKRPGQYIFVPRRYYGFSNCLFSEQNFSNVEFYLKECTFYRLNRLYLNVLQDLPYDQRLRFNYEHFLSSYSDRYGRIDYLRHLWKNDVIAAIGIPYNYEQNEKIRKWLSFYSPKPEQLGEVQNVDDLASPALTDEMAEDAEQQGEEELNLTNPRWEHKDEARKEKSPDSTIEGDLVILKVDVTGAPEGASIGFDIFDTSADPPVRLDTVEGENKEGVGSGEWTVEDPRKEGEEEKELKIEFEGSFRSKTSERVEIPVEELPEFDFSI